MSQAQRTIKVLLIQRGDAGGPPIAEMLGPSVDVIRADSVEDAQSLFIDNDFDYVIASPSTLPGASKLPGRSVESDALAECCGVGIVDAHGKLTWANPALLGYPEEVRGLVRKACEEAFSWATSDSAGDKSNDPAGRQTTLQSSDGGVYNLTATPIIDIHNRVTQVVALVGDVTRRRARQKRLLAVDHAGRELLRLDSEQVSQLATHERLALLEQKIIRYLHDLMQFDNFSIHLLDKKTNKLEPVLLSGMPKTVQTIDLYARPEGNGIAGYVAYHGRSYNCPDVAKDPLYFKGLEDARSSLTVPLFLNDEVIGILNVESGKPAAFDHEQCQMAEILGRDIATSLHILDLLVAERYTTTGQLGQDVMVEVTGPLNDILTDVENLIEDYIGHDDLRHRLNAITSNAVAIREAIKRVTSPKRGLLGHRPTGVKRRDPILTGKKLLIADDEPMIRDTVRDVLVSYGCEVTVVENGGKAIELIGRESFDLVLSDIKMPGKSGYEVFAAAKDANADTPVILMTGFGYDPNHSLVRARREGLAAVLFKPFKVDQLLGEIRAALHTPSD